MGLGKIRGSGVLANISTSGMYICIERSFQVGNQEYLAVQLSSMLTEDGPKNKYLTTGGNVVRVEALANHTNAATIKFDTYRFD